MGLGPLKISFKHENIILDPTPKKSPFSMKCPDVSRDPFYKRT